MTDREQVEALIARVEHKMLPAAQAFINQHFGNDGSKPQISIPADRDGDSDLILIGGLRELQNTLRTLLRERDAAEALANERAADAAGRIGWHCVSCGHVCKDPEKDLETLRKAGARSCCPEREMEPLSETLNAALAPSPNALAEHDAKVRAEERERAARIAENWKCLSKRVCVIDRIPDAIRE